MQNNQIDQIKKAALEEHENAKKGPTIKYKHYNHKTKKVESREKKVGRASKGSRIIVFGIMILIELAILVYILARFMMSFVWVVVVFYVIGVILAIRVAVSENKNYDSKIAWMIALVVLAPLTVFAYLAAGEITNTPPKSRRLRKIEAKTKYLEKTIDFLNEHSRVQIECEFAQNTTDFVAYHGDDAKYFPTGEDFFEDVLEQLQTAQKFIFLDFFILSAGHLATRIFQILVDKVNQGVDVRVIVDGFGSYGALSRKRVRKIRKTGIKIEGFAKIIPILNLTMNYRDHRKVIVIDGNIGYVGGANIADEYINAKQRYGHWKDAGLKIQGYSVRSLTLAFLRLWEFCTKKEPNYLAFLDASVKSTVETNQIVLPYVDGPETKTSICKDMYINIISNAKEKLYIMSPYFVINKNIIQMICNKAIGGVDVRLIIPGTPDKKYVYALTKYNANILVNAGVKVYKYSPGFIHSKVVYSDDQCAVVGSVNFDFRSFYQQYESAVYTTIDSVLKEIDNDFENTFLQSELMPKLKRSNIIKRGWVAFLRLMSPLM